MTSLATAQPRPGPLGRAAAAVDEAPRPVFATAHGRRARVVKIAALTLFGMAVLWLAALFAGVLGLGHLPGVPLTPGARSAGEPQKAAPGAHRSAAAARAPDRRAGAPAHGRSPRGDAPRSHSRSSQARKGAGIPATRVLRAPARRAPAPRAPAYAPGRAISPPRPGARRVTSSPAPTTTPAPEIAPTTGPGRSGAAPGSVHRNGAARSPSAGTSPPSTAQPDLIGPGSRRWRLRDG